MRRTIMRLVAVAGIIAVPFAVQAHDPPDYIMPAVQFPDGNTPIIDGIMDDWAPVPPEQYGQFTEQMCPVGSTAQEGGPNEGAVCGTLDPSDMAIHHVTGWNESGNWFYWKSEIFDDVKVARRQNPGSFFWDDSIEYQLNTLHQAAEDLNPGETVTSVDYNYGIPPIEGAFEFYRPLRNLPWLVNGTQWVTLGWTWEGEFTDGPGTYFYEFRIRPIETMPRSEEATESQVVIGDLQEGQIVHWGAMINDADEGDGSENFRKAQWSIAPTGGNALAVTDVLLAPMDPGITWGPPRTSVEATSWGRIKAQF